MLALVCSLFHSCEEEPYVSTPDSRIKRVLYSFTTNDTVPLRTFEYTYDSKKRLTKIQDEWWTELFEYNSKDQLLHKILVNNDSRSEILADTTYYEYNDGLLVSEKRQRWNSPSESYINKSVYEYDQSRLIRKKNYDSGGFEDMVIYEYTGDLLTKEITYRDSTATDYQLIREYRYDKDKLSLCTLINSDKWIIQVVYSLYDQIGRLDLEYSIQHEGISAGLTYCKRYEYY